MDVQSLCKSPETSATNSAFSVLGQIPGATGGNIKQSVFQSGGVCSTIYSANAPETQLIDEVWQWNLSRGTDFMLLEKNTSAFLRNPRSLIMQIETGCRVAVCKSPETSAVSSAFGVLGQIPGATG
ncbi:hypothetical protein CEXT_530711 [Caerostris extrusa]|uniref:Uncharacterized protein n=1 Tax=Caerostris extrusa TaxID=172846 RepID=A0AAV4WH97_CAEEX|nr:hypothetical protein CEXT_530711 [Caerostris extrusa]